MPTNVILNDKRFAAWLKEAKNTILQYMKTKHELSLNPCNYSLSKEAEKRLKWLYILYEQQKGNVTKTASNIGISRQWLSTLKSVFEKSGHDPRVLEPESKAPRNTDNRKRIPKEIEGKILQVRGSTPGWGKEKIARILKRDYGIVTGESTVNRYLHKHGKINPKISEKNQKAWERKKERETMEPKLKVKYRPPKAIKDYIPGALIEKDMKLISKTSQISEKHRARENFWYQHTEIDSFTRIRTLELVAQSDSKTAVAAHRKATRRFPFAIACTNTDNGSENEKHFSRMLRADNVFQFYSNTGTPTDNPRVERSHLTDDKEFYERGNVYETFQEQRKASKQWEYIYNYKRPHQALGQLTPIEFYQLWKRDPKEAYAITEKYQLYLARQGKRLASARRLKKKEQIESLMKFIDAKLKQKVDLRQEKKQLINCQLCSWT